MINEVAASRVAERGSRADDRRSEAAMEDRKNKVISRNFTQMTDQNSYLNMDLLRFTTAEVLTTEKALLLGDFFTIPKQFFEDQLEAIEKSSKQRGDEHVNLALLTDGLRAEREQGITIDAAYRYFATPKRKFIIADTPGHIQYTRNMVTGASTANWL